MQTDLGGGYNRYAVKLIAAAVTRAHGAEPAARLVQDLDLARVPDIL